MSTSKTIGVESLLVVSELPKSKQISRARKPLPGLLTKTPAPKPEKLETTAATHLSAWLPYLAALKSLILQDLENHLGRLLALNMSRREAIANHLDRLSGDIGPQQPDSSGGLRRWIEEPRSPAQNRALQSYFEEVALLVLGQAILLKAWSDRCLRVWSPADLNDLNWAMNTALKPHIPLDRDTWQVVRQNIYSWYKPSPAIQREIWITLEPWKIPGENPTFLAALISSTRKARPDSAEPEGYDSRFYQSLWENIPFFGFDPENSCPAYRRSWHAFSPTLRDGAVVRNGPSGIQWVGLESSSFLVMMAELLQLWWGPSAPPLWTVGNGLEVPTRDQLMLNLGSSSGGPGGRSSTGLKPSLFSRIAEMEACDAAFVFEERSVRGQGRTAESQAFRMQADSNPYFRKLRATRTSLGDLQACVAISKLRPGGLLWWAREELLDERAGSEVLNFLLEKGKLICEWNLSEVEHGLPSKRPLFSRYIYLFQREPRIEERITHRPMRVAVQGQIRSHVEIPQLLEDALRSGARSEITPHGQWTIQAQESPIPQKDWAERWPEPAAHSTLMRLEALREASLPLASATTIRPTPDRPNWSMDGTLKGFWVQAENRSLVTRALPKPNEMPDGETSGSGFLILVTDESIVSPLKHYLESETVRQWLDQRCERKGDRWILTEQIIRWIPVKRTLLRTLGLSGEAPRGPAILPPEWERTASRLANEPGVALDAVKSLKTSQKTQPGIEVDAILAELFVRTSRTLEYIKSPEHPSAATLRLIGNDGRILWRKLLDILPRTECISVTLHPRVSIQGSLPLHLPIGEVTPIKTPEPGFLLMTEAGLSLKILSESSLIREMLSDQLQGPVNPTWSELLHYLKLPRRLEIAEETATEILRAHGEHAKKIAGLVQLLGECSSIEHL
ncbi:MAG: hypothetical protein P4M08_15205 [Oligoflexia bacterium]|nr:hypothetical protein [Oligoflexia bacterium]